MKIVLGKKTHNISKKFGSTIDNILGDFLINVDGSSQYSFTPNTALNKKARRTFEYSKEWNDPQKHKFFFKKEGENKVWISLTSSHQTLLGIIRTSKLTSKCPNREEKWWCHKYYKICEITGLVGISRKNKTKNFHLPKISLLIQVGEITL